MVGKWLVIGHKRLDAERNYIIQTKALDGIWPVGHGCAVFVLRHGGGGASAQHFTAMTN